jgi:hypothetical protein
MDATLNVGQILEAAHVAPYSTLDERLGKGGLVVIAPHPDDESLACGGLIAEARTEVPTPVPDQPRNGVAVVNGHRLILERGTNRIIQDLD